MSPSKNENANPNAPPEDEEEDNPYTITEEILQQRMQRTKSGRYATQFYAAVTASFAAISFGTVLGWSSPILYEANYGPEAVNFTVDEHSWVASVVAGGAAIGIIPWSYCNREYGPRKTMLFQAPFNVASWLVIANVNLMKNVHIASRFFCGLLSISYMVCGECLLVDTVHQHNLQHMCVMYHSSVFLGVMFAWVMGQLFRKHVTGYSCASFCVLHALLLFFLPESPVFLYERSAKKAEASLAWYRGRTDVSTEMKAIKKHYEMRKVDPAANSVMLFRKVVVKAVLIVMGIKFFEISSGYYVFLFYNVDMLHEFHYNLVEDLHATTIYGGLMYLARFVSMLIHFRKIYTIRKPLIASSVLVTIVLAVFAAYLYLISIRLRLAVEVVNIVPTLCVCLLIIGYESGLSCYAEIALIDYVPHEVYHMVREIIHIWHWTLVFLLVKNIITIRDYTPHSYMCILVLVVLSFLGIFYMKFFVVETKGKSLLEVQREIGGNPIGSRGRLKHYMHPVTSHVVS